MKTEKKREGKWTYTEGGFEEMKYEIIEKEERQKKTEKKWEKVK